MKKKISLYICNDLAITPIRKRDEIHLNFEAFEKQKAIGLQTTFPFEPTAVALSQGKFE